MEPFKILTVKEAAKFLQVSSEEVRRLVKTRKLDALFFGRKKSKTRIPSYALEEFVKREIAEIAAKSAESLQRPKTGP